MKNRRKMSYLTGVGMLAAALCAGSNSSLIAADYSSDVDTTHNRPDNHEYEKPVDSDVEDFKTTEEKRETGEFEDLDESKAYSEQKDEYTHDRGESGSEGTSSADLKKEPQNDRDSGREAEE